MRLIPDAFCHYSAASSEDFKLPADVVLPASCPSDRIPVEDTGGGEHTADRSFGAAADECWRASGCWPSREFLLLELRAIDELHASLTAYPPLLVLSGLGASDVSSRRRTFAAFQVGASIGQPLLRAKL